jgi:hypothetical protein
MTMIWVINLEISSTYEYWKNVQCVTMNTENFAVNGQLQSKTKIIVKSGCFYNRSFVLFVMFYLLYSSGRTTEYICLRQEILPHIINFCIFIISGK